MKKIGLVLICLVAAFTSRAQAQAPAVVALGNCAASLGAPARVALDSAGNLYVTDPQAGQVGVFDPFSRPAGVRQGFSKPLGIAIDPQGRVFLAEEGAGSVSVFDARWNLLYKLGSGDGEFQLPNYLALVTGPSGTIAYVSDSRANEVKAYAGAELKFRFGAPGSGDGQFDFPAGICANAAGELFVVDQNNDRVQVFDGAGLFLRAFPLGAGGAGSPSGRSQGAFIDTAERLYVADTFQGIVRVFDSRTGALLSTLGGFGQALGQLAAPGGLAQDSLSRLFVASATTRRVEVYGIDSFLHVVSEPAGGVVPSGTNLLLKAVTGGTGPFSFQWRKDGSELDGATNATLDLPGVGATDAGAYSVVVTGPMGTLVSGATQVEVMAAPSIISDPQSLTVLRGSNVVMEVSALGAALTYQWQLNGLNVTGASSNALVLPDVQLYQAGTYTVIVSNAAGSVVTFPAVLTVLSPPTLFEVVSASLAPDGLFHLTLNADPGFRYSLDASTDLAHWVSLTNFDYDAGLAEFVDGESTNFWSRLYRFRWLP